MAISYTTRKINYFELLPVYTFGSSANQFISIFHTIQNYQSQKNPNRFFQSNDKLLYMSALVFDINNNRIRGKLSNIRMDIFPELIDTNSDIIRDIVANATEGIIETSHFILSFKNNSLLLSMEFNQYGPRISDFINFIVNKFQNSRIFENLDYNNYSRDDLPKYKQRINRISVVTAKVHKDNFRRINDVDSELFDAFDTVNKISEAEYVTLDLNYDYRTSFHTQSIRTKIMHIIDKLINDKTATNLFSTLKVKAEDQASNNKIKEFDLLNIWVKSEIKVEKKENSRVIVSADIFEKMQDELDKEFAR